MEQKEKLHQRFKHYGALHLETRRICIGMLPEVCREKIYEEKGFDSIFEYAAKLAGLSQEQVKRALSLHEKFEDKPVLKNLLETGEVSINKLAKIASIATTENQEILADKVRLLPCRALETLVRDIKRENVEAELMCGDEVGEMRGDAGQMCGDEVGQAHYNEIGKSQDGLQKPLFGNIFVHVNKSEEELLLSEEARGKLLELQKMGIDINDLIEKMLQKREQDLVEEEEKLSAEAKPTDSRYIPKKFKEFLKKKYGTKCSIRGCSRPSKQTHHTQRFALARMHDIKYMAPLCEEHHIIAQTYDIKYVQVRMAVTMPTGAQTAQTEKKYSDILPGAT